MIKHTDVEQAKQALRAALQRHNLLIFVGAGCTAATVDDLTAYPAATWPGLIQEGIQFGTFKRLLTRNDARYLNVQLKQKDYISAATYLVNKLGGQESQHFKDWLGNSVGSLPVVSSQLIDTLVQLKAPILTTNYDTLIEQVTDLDSYHQASKPVVLQELIQGYQPGVIHVHGLWDEPETIVFNFKSYYDATHNRPLQELIRSVFITKTVLFIGFGGGLDDPNLGPLISSYKTDFGRQHYQLVLESHVPRYQDIAGVKRVAFGTNYPDLEPFLRSLLTKSPDELKADFLLGVPVWKHVLDSVYLNKKWLKNDAEFNRFQELYADFQELLRAIRVVTLITPIQQKQAVTTIEQMEKIVTDTVAKAHQLQTATDQDLLEWMTIKSIANKDIIGRLNALS